MLLSQRTKWSESGLAEAPILNAMELLRRGQERARHADWKVTMLRVSGILLVALTALPGYSQAPPDQRPCLRAVQILASAALRHIVAVRDLPDFSLVAADRPILVSNFVSGLNCELHDAVLPTPSELPLQLVPPGQLQLAANTDGRVRYVEVSHVWGLDETDGSIVVGVSMLLPENSDDVLECCCSGEATFTKVENEWVFVAWGPVVCS